MPTSLLNAVTVRTEKWTAVLEEMRPLFPEHFKELGINQHRLNAVADEIRYAELERLGILFVLTARFEGRLVGYFVGFTMPHLHYRGAGSWAMTDMYYVKPEYRHGTGLQLFRAFKQLARQRGCKFAITSCKVHEDHSEFLQKLGFAWTDKTFIASLEDR